MGSYNERLGVAFGAGILGGGVVSTLDGGLAALGALVLFGAALYGAKTAADMEWKHIGTYGRALFLPVLLPFIGYGFVANPKPVAEPYAAMVPEAGVIVLKATGYAGVWVGTAVFAVALKKAISELAGDSGGGAPTAEDLDERAENDEEDSNWDFLSLA